MKKSKGCKLYEYTVHKIIIGAPKIRNDYNAIKLFSFLIALCKVIAPFLYCSFYGYRLPTIAIVIVVAFTQS